MSVPTKELDDASCLENGAAADDQLTFSRTVIQAFDFERGRLAVTPHSFSTRGALDAVRDRRTR